MVPGAEPALETNRKERIMRRRTDFACRRLRSTLGDDHGALTAEYAIIILAAVALAGVLVTIVRSEEVRSMLLELVQNALGSAG